MQVSEANAVASAKIREGLDPNATNFTVTLGSFTDTQYMVRDSTGSYSRVANGLPAYVVTFSGLNILPEGPAPTGTFNTEDNVVVDASTGAIVETFTYQ
ncbi:MAG: hypothetical protein ACYDB2_02350 [Acidimicrobiales bacterium]